MRFNYKIKGIILYSLIILIIAGFFLGSCLFYPDILWGISFLGHELSFNINNFFSTSEGIIKYAPNCQNCNIILISLDTLRADHLSCYGYNRETSPNIDKLAEESILFEDAFSNAYFTLPSHMSIFTSLYPTTHKINNLESKPLSTDFKTFAEIFKKEGYRTIWFGPLFHSHLSLDQGFGRGFDEFYPFYFSQMTYFPDSTKFNKTLFSDVLNQDLDKKFFLFFYSNINHAPYIYPEEFNFKFSNKSYSGRLPQDYNDLIDSCSIKMKKSFENNPDYIYQPALCYYHFLDDNSNEILPSDEDISEVSNRYDNGVFYVDYLLGELLAELEQLDLSENTVIIIASDHGEELFEHNGFDHDDFYDHTVHVPFIIKVPGLQKKIEVTGLTQNIDILPITLTLAKLTSPEFLEGRGLQQILENNNKRYVFGYSLGDTYARSEKWKYIKHRDGEEELYYLLNDPLERHNLINSKSLIVNNFRKTICDELIKWETSQF